VRPKSLRIAFVAENYGGYPQYGEFPSPTSSNFWKKLKTSNNPKHY
jgi:hypothetical protein